METDLDKCQTIINMRDPSNVKRALNYANMFHFLCKWQGFPFLCHFEEKRWVRVDERVRGGVRQLEVLFGATTHFCTPNNKLAPLSLPICYWPSNEFRSRPIGKQSPTTSLCREQLLWGHWGLRLAWTIMITARKLMPYFQRHQVMVKINCLIRQVLK